jgi:hypothetical protein
MQASYAAVKARLETAGRTVFDGPISQLSITDLDYYVLTDDTVALPAGYVRLSSDMQATFRTLCVSRTASGARRVADDCRTALTDWSPDPGRSDPLTEIESGPILRDTEGADTRFSITLIHRTIATREMP